ncbi:MAG: hypothetical protein HY043_15285 [Verrucomicrobia bacterium]|nr:hypothetical protein [Verrucomicrobiota bacterium]
MQARLWKEFHFLLLPMLTTVLLPLGVGFIFPSGDNSTVLVAMAFACALVGASAFGTEFAHGTMAQLLAQPVNRSRLWSEKMLALGVALAPTIGVACWLAISPFDEPQFRATILGLMAMFIPLCAICATPYLTLLSRSTIGAVVFSIMVPLLVLGVCSALAQLLSNAGFLDELGMEATARSFPNEQAFVLFAFAALTLYCAAFAWLGYRKFKNYEVIEQFPAEMRLGDVFEIPLRWMSASCFPSRRSAVWSLIAKELRLQHMTFMLTAVFWLLQAAAVIFIKAAHPLSGDVYWLVPFVLHVALIPVVVGGLCVAEERNLGLLGWHLTLPVSAFKQWLIKLAVCLPLSLLLGVVLPYGCMLVAHAAASEIPSPGSLESWPVLLACLAQLLITGTAIYGSSISHNTLRAIVLGMVMAVAWSIAVGVIQRATGFLGLMGEETLAGAGEASHAAQIQQWISVASYVAFTSAMLATIVSVLACAFGNFRRVDVEARRLWHHALIVFSPVIVIGWLATLIVSFLVRLAS